MTKWLIFVFFIVCLVVAMQIEQLWTLWVLIPTFAWLYNWAEIMEDTKAPLLDRTRIHDIDGNSLQNH